MWLKRQSEQTLPKKIRIKANTVNWYARNYTSVNASHKWLDKLSSLQIWKLYTLRPKSYIYTSFRRVSWCTFLVLSPRVASESAKRSLGERSCVSKHCSFYQTIKDQKANGPHRRRTIRKSWALQYNEYLYIANKSVNVTLIY